MLKFIFAINCLIVKDTIQWKAIHFKRKENIYFFSMSTKYYYKMSLIRIILLAINKMFAWAKLKTTILELLCSESECVSEMMAYEGEILSEINTF